MITLYGNLDLETWEKLLKIQTWMTKIMDKSMPNVTLETLNLT
jgi:hypothetical protein